MDTVTLEQVKAQEILEILSNIIQRSVAKKEERLRSKVVIIY